MSKAVKCPICDGNGQVPNTYPVTAPALVTCHGCGGRGWVEVSEGEWKR